MRKNKIASSALFITVFLLCLSAFAQQPENVTITTYYPSPYGSYNELRARKVAIGNGYIDSSSHPILTGTSLIVEETVGIGTATPDSRLKLQVNGGTGIGAASGTQSYIVLGGGGNGANYIESGAALSAGSTADLNFTNMFNTKQFMTIRGNGNVGIGTYPLFPLDVNGDIFTNHHLWVTGADAGIELRWDGGVPYIDFKDRDVDYMMRLIMGAPDALIVQGGRLCIGDTNNCLEPRRDMVSMKNMPIGTWCGLSPTYPGFMPGPIVWANPFGALCEGRMPPACPVEDGYWVHAIAWTQMPAIAIAYTCIKLS